jgi:hypothetical protein
LRLNSSVDTANGELSAIRKLWEEQLKKTSELRPSQFKDNLPQTANALKAARILRIAPLPQIASIQESLLATNTTSPGYWDAASELISYRSSQESTIRLGLQMPSCYKTPPGIYLEPGQSSPPILTVPKEWRSCAINLEEETPQEWLDAIIGTKDFRAAAGKQPGDFVILTDCLIRYHGGPIPERAYELLAVAVFRHCFLEFSFSGPPPPNGKKVVDALLGTSFTSDVRLPSLRQ